MTADKSRLSGRATGLRGGSLLRDVARRPQEVRARARERRVRVRSSDLGLLARVEQKSSSRSPSRPRRSSTMPVSKKSRDENGSGRTSQTGFTTRCGRAARGRCGPPVKRRPLRENAVPRRRPAGGPALDAEHRDAAGRRDAVAASRRAHRRAHDPRRRRSPRRARRALRATPASTRLSHGMFTT